MNATNRDDKHRLSYRWNLRQRMAAKEMYSTTDLVGPLRDRGVQLSTAQIYRLVAQTPERLNLKVLVALCDILGCTPTDLIEPVEEKEVKKKQVSSSQDSSGAAPTSNSDGIRPRRADITDDDQQA